MGTKKGWYLMSEVEGVIGIQCWKGGGAVDLFRGKLMMYKT